MLAEGPEILSSAVCVTKGLGSQDLFVVLWGFGKDPFPRPIEPDISCPCNRYAALSSRCPRLEGCACVRACGRSEPYLRRFRSRGTPHSSSSLGGVG